MLEWCAMKRIKQIIEALKVIHDTPSSAIHEAFCRVLSDVGNGRATKEDLSVISKVVYAVVGLAEEMERPAKADSEVKS